MGVENGVYDASEGCEACWRGLGVNEKRRAAILLPRFEDVRYTAAAKFWVVDSLRMNFEALELLDERMKEPMRVHYIIDRSASFMPSMHE